MPHKHPFLRNPKEQLKQARKEAKKAAEEKTQKMFIALVLSSVNIQIKPEVRFHAIRKFRFDYANEQYKVAIEVEGGIFMKGNSGHSSGVGIKRDMEKQSLAASMGWLVIRVQPKQLLTMQTVELIKQAISYRKNG